MILKNLKSPAVLALTLCMGMAHTGFGQDEYDDMYFSSKDRKKIKYTQENTEASITYESYSNNTYDNPSYSAKEVNPEYIEKYKQQARASVASEVAAAEGNTNPTYSSTDYFVEGEVADYDNPSFYDDPKYNRQNESTVVNNNYYGNAYRNPYYGGFNSWGPSMMMSYTNWGGWSYGMSYGFGWGNGYYDPFFYDPFYCPVYSYNSYRWYGNGYNRGFYNGYNYGYYAANGIDNGYQRHITRGARGSRVQSAASNSSIVKYSSTTPARSSGRAVATSGRASGSTRITSTPNSSGRVANQSNNQVQSQNEYLRKANVSTSRSRLTELSNRTNSRSAVSSRTTYTNNNSRVSSNLNRQNNSITKTPSVSTRTTRSDNSSRSSSGNVRRYNSQSSSYSSPSRSSYSGTRSSSPSRSYAAPSRSSSGTRSSGSSSGSSSRSSSRGRR